MAYSAFFADAVITAWLALDVRCSTPTRRLTSDSGLPGIAGIKVQCVFSL